VNAFVAAGAGFLLAVLWFDLMFDVQALRAGDAVLPEEVLASIAGYYRRVTRQAQRMNKLVAAVMAGTLAARVMIPSGMTARNTQRQDSASSMMPPMKGPAHAPA